MAINASKYIVRQPIKDLKGKTLAYEIRYAGEDSAYDTGDGGQDFAAADLYDKPPHEADAKTL